MRAAQVLAARVVGLALCALKPAFADMWYVYQPITTPVITAPTTAHNGVGIEGEVQFTCTACSDVDKHVVDGNPTYPSDTVTYTWWAAAGSFPYGNSGTSVIWKAPSTPGYYEVKVIVDDLDHRAAPGHGSDDDVVKGASLCMHVIKLDKIELTYFNHHTGYPYVGSPVSIRAVVWFTCTGDGGPRCDLSFDPELEWWWAAGSEGPQTDGIPPPVTPVFQAAAAVGDWPDFLPPLTIEWKELKHRGSDAQDPDSDYDRKYWYDESVHLTNSWGEDNCTFDTPGVHRLQATATVHPGELWEKSVVSPANERALRICTKGPAIYVEPSPPPENSEQRRDYLEWLTTYETEPYEWGGEGFGGLDSGDQWRGGDDRYEQYGMDCSGLVSCGACRAGYKWRNAPGGWRHTTRTLEDVTTAVADPWKDNILPGDIMNRYGHHVRSYCRKEGTAPNRRFYVVEAIGTEQGNSDDNRVIQRWQNESRFGGYEGRELSQYAGCPGGRQCGQ